MVTRLPVSYDLTCYKGQSYCQNLRFKTRQTDPETGTETLVTYPLTGYTAKAEIRPRENTTRLTAEMIVNVTQADGMISLAMTEDMTVKIPAGSYVWDLYTVHNGKKQYWIRGKIQMIGRVTV